MDIKGFAKATLPVIVGVFLAGLAMNALRDNNIVGMAIDGYDS